MIKKGQFYLFTAVTLCSLVFFTLVNKAVFHDYDDTFNRVTSNYITEAPFVINNALYENKNISLQMENYTFNFIEYSKTRNIDLGILYILVLKNNMRIVNYLNEPVYFIMGEDSGYLPLAPLESAAVNATGNFSIRLNDSSYYSFNVSQGEAVQFKALLKKT